MSGLQAPQVYADRSAGLDGCWPWLGSVDRHGYGRYRERTAHRVIFEAEYGPIPSDFAVDHICFNTLCVNPAHLRVLTWQENSARQRQALATSCANGHPFDEANTYRRPTGQRGCRACNAAAQARVRARRKVA
jgi:hypothetical protein